MKFENEHERYVYRQELIDNIMDWFDFEKVAKVMLFLDWKWQFAQHPPEIQEIREYVRDALKKCFDRHMIHGETGYHGSGGFEITCNGDEKEIWFNVKFVLADWSTCDD